MQTLIRHLVDNNLPQIVEKSLLNCHCIGLHSIMLLESPGQTIRLYVADKGNDLYKNAPWHYERGMSIGFHPHHCNLTLHCIKGKFWNWGLAYPRFIESQINQSISIGEYRYQSKITDGEQGFRLVNPNTPMLLGMYDLVESGQSKALSAKSLHTVVCDPFEVSAWLVYEGKEDPSYEPVCFSTSNLLGINTDGLYQKPTPQQVREILDLALSR